MPIITFLAIIIIDKFHVQQDMGMGWANKEKGNRMVKAYFNCEPTKILL